MKHLLTILIALTCTTTFAQSVIVKGAGAGAVRATGAGSVRGVATAAAGTTTTGGTITNYTEGGTNFQAHTFLSNGIFTVSGGTITGEFLLVAGGGGAGATTDPYDDVGSGGAGAGGLVYTSSYVMITQSYSIIVGIGGLGINDPTSHGGNGGNSSFSNLVAIGGGGGGSSGDAGPPGPLPQFGSCLVQYFWRNRSGERCCQ